VTPRWHGVFDYAGAAGLLFAPFALGLAAFSEVAVVISVVLGLGLLLYSAFTDYDFGIVGMLSITSPLAVDCIAGAFLLGVALFSGFDFVVRVYFAVMGLGVLSAVVITDSEAA
jgi:hypothetical protein